MSNSRWTVGFARGYIALINRFSLISPRLLYSLLFILVIGPVNGELTRTQSITLQPGWNAVFLEVQPFDSNPTAVFANTFIDIASLYIADTFLATPQRDWLVWYADRRDDAFLTTLHAIDAQHTYLVHNTSQQTINWQLEGRVVMDDIRWQANAYNLVGFSVDSDNAPTFADFFAASSAHRNSSIYRMQQGHWRQLTKLTSATLRSGEAFWIYCRGPSNYQGPLTVSASTHQGLLLGDLLLGRQVDSVILRNHSNQTLTPTVQHLASAADAVPLSIVIQTVGNDISARQRRSVAAKQPAADWTLALPPLASGRAIRLPLQARLEDMTRSVHHSLLKISTDLGTVTWIPVFATREDLK